MALANMQPKDKGCAVNSNVESFVFLNLKNWTRTNIWECLHVVVYFSLTDELDSYMFQTVGHQAVDMYADAMGVPLFRRIIEGNSVSTGKNYEQNEADEVEDMFALLKKVKVKRFSKV